MADGKYSAAEDRWNALDQWGNVTRIKPLKGGVARYRKAWTKPN